MTHAMTGSAPDTLAEGRALIALGANAGAPAAQLRDACERLAASPLIRGPIACSSFWRSDPVDCPPGSPDFVNAVAVCDLAADVTPQELLDALLRIERAAGRLRGERNAPRPLDLDLLLYGSRRLHTDTLTLPHPRAHLRAFVMVPAAELVPDLVWPGTDRRVVDLAARLAPGAGLQRLDERG